MGFKIGDEIEWKTNIGDWQDKPEFYHKQAIKYLQEFGSPSKVLRVEEDYIEVNLSNLNEPMLVHEDWFKKVIRNYYVNEEGFLTCDKNWENWLL